MTNLLTSAFGKILEWLFGKGVEGLGERAHVRWLRRIAVTLAIACAAWVAVASALLWQSARVPGVVGLWEYTQAGGPSWSLATPILAALTTLLLLIPLKGRHSIGALLAAGTMGFGIGSLAEFQGGGQYAVNLYAGASVVASIILTLLTLTLCLGDVPALDSFMARFSMVYWGRIRHLKTLRAYGLRRGWEVTGPGGPENALRVRGSLDESHQVRATSAAKFKLSTENAASYFMDVDMSSPRDIIPLRVSFERPDKELAARGVSGLARAKGKRTLYFTLVPDPRLPIPPLFVARFAHALDTGRRFLRYGDYLVATPHGVSLHHVSGAFVFKASEAELDPTLAWLREVVGLLEEVTPPDAAPIERFRAASLPQR